LGKMLRLDVDNGDPYAIPRDNPFVGQNGARPEIWAYGLRNPWRYSFDRASGDLWIADVGQNRAEEINVQPAGSRGGENYGWSVMEGLRCLRGDSCDQNGLTLPIAEYTREEGLSVTGGYVYRGSASPALVGAYFFADYGSGRIWSLHQGADGGWIRTELLDTDLGISSFGEDEAGELYLTDLRGGGVYQVTAQPR
jgi:glucose/arabinose dehydrogenase